MILITNVITWTKDECPRPPLLFSILLTLFDPTILILELLTGLCFLVFFFFLSAVQLLSVDKLKTKHAKTKQTKPQITRPE